MATIQTPFNMLALRAERVTLSNECNKIELFGDDLCEPIFVVHFDPRALAEAAGWDSQLPDFEEWIQDAPGATHADYEDWLDGAGWIDACGYLQQFPAILLLVDYCSYDYCRLELGPKY